MSAREVKQYDERMEEILDTSQDLFAEFGYEKVSVQKIIDRIGIAKGTFYHYFASKEDLLDALVVRFTEALILELKVIVEDPKLSGIEKLNELMIQGTIKKLRGSYSDIILVFSKVMQNPANSLLVQKIQTNVQVMAIPLYASILKQGSEEGDFDIEYFEESAEMMIALSKSLQSKFISLFSIDKCDELKAEFERIMHIFERSIERLLGAAKGSIIFVTPETLELVAQFCSKL